MPKLRFAKHVGTLPASIDADTLYFLRAGDGFDLYLSDTTGTVAHQINYPVQYAYPKRSSTPKVAGEISGAALTTLTLIAARLYFIPFVVPRPVLLTGLRISVTTASVGTASIGIYGNSVIAGDDAPGPLLAQVTGLDTVTPGDKTGTLAITLQPGVIYWACVIASAAPTVRALGVNSVHAALGRVVNSTSAITHLFAAGLGSTLPATAPPTTAGTGSPPAIYLLE